MQAVNRVFFRSREDAIALGYRPCGHCCKQEYLQWKTMNRTAPDNLLPFQGEALLFPAVCTHSEREAYLQRLLQETDWKQEAIRLFGRQVMQPRLTAWYGDTGVRYGYSGIRLEPQPWTDTLLELKALAERYAGCRFNSALLNLYRDGNDSMGWHRDNERALGPEPLIASLSLGAERKFRFRLYRDKRQTVPLTLPSGSLLLMRGATQEHWEHQLPKSAAAPGPRINITFRNIVTGTVRKRPVGRDTAPGSATGTAPGSSPSHGKR